MAAGQRPRAQPRVRREPVGGIVSMSGENFLFHSWRT